MRPAVGQYAAVFYGQELRGAIGFAILPVCIAVAVLKYRLYSIDRIISRVVAYAVITAVLAGVFTGLVLLATEVLPFKTPVAVAAATLAAAALFNPLRRRVQRGVDRRFNRARHNAETVIAAFTARLRQTVDLDTAQGDLVDAVARSSPIVVAWPPARTRPVGTLSPSRSPVPLTRMIRPKRRFRATPVSVRKQPEFAACRGARPFYPVSPHLPSEPDLVDDATYRQDQAQSDIDQATGTPRRP